MKHQALLLIGCVALGAGPAFSAEAKKEPAKASEAAQAAPAPAEPAAAKPLSPEDQIRAQLDGSEWAVQLSPSAGAKAAVQKDTISFTKKQVKSSFMEKAGYAASNYSLSLGDDGRAVWETMQTKEGVGVAFWRGEVEGQTMRGVLSKHPTEGASEDYSLSGQIAGGKKITIPGAVAPAPSAVQVQSAVAQQAAPAVKQAQKAVSSTPAAAAHAKPVETKKKRGWF